MATEATLPEVGFSMTEYVINEWLTAAGTVVQENERFFTLATDETTLECWVSADGKLKIAMPATGKSVSRWQDSRFRRPGPRYSL